ncbi:hypothetical protein AGLY_014542 [Aphis glycines]|uniref:Uncharacterized protein n=1 Tax=Aphis glycines TaxID=307491 RepID=A0A6G0T3Y7_APHGL|nr:hypothetical protein AGLY_014542 [Aphis glycines]
MLKYRQKIRFSRLTSITSYMPARMISFPSFPILFRPWTIGKNRQRFSISALILTAAKTFTASNITAGLLISSDRAITVNASLWPNICFKPTLNGWLVRAIRRDTTQLYVLLALKSGCERYWIYSVGLKFNLHYLIFYNASLTFFFYSQPIDLLLGSFFLLISSNLSLSASTSKCSINISHSSASY